MTINHSAPGFCRLLDAAGRALPRIRVGAAKARYDVGTVNYLKVADAERNALLQERRQAQLYGQRFTASVRLIKTLGGGW